MRYLLETKTAGELEARDLVLLSVAPVEIWRVLGVEIDRAADHPQWTGGDQVRVAFDPRDVGRGNPSLGIYHGSTTLILLVPA